MQIIMLKDVDKVGDKHEVVTVKNGFGRNYLIPQGLAILANKSNLGRLAEMTRREAVQEKKRLDEYKEMAKVVNGKQLIIVAKAGTSGKIFGSITPLMVSTQLQEQFGIEVPRKKILMPESAKELGNYPLTIAFYETVKAELTLCLVDKVGDKPAEDVAEAAPEAPTEE